MSGKHHDEHGLLDCERLDVWQPKHEAMLSSTLSFPTVLVQLIGSYLPALQGQEIARLQLTRDITETVSDLTLAPSGELLLRMTSRLCLFSTDKFAICSELDFKQDVEYIEQTAWANDQVCAVQFVTYDRTRHIVFVECRDSRLELLGELQHRCNQIGAMAQMLFLSDGRLLHADKGGHVHIYSRPADAEESERSLFSKYDGSFATGLWSAARMCEIGNGIVLTAWYPDLVEWDSRTLQTLRRFQFADSPGQARELCDMVLRGWRRGSKEDWKGKHLFLWSLLEPPDFQLLGVCPDGSMICQLEDDMDHFFLTDFTGRCLLKMKVPSPNVDKDNCSSNSNDNKDNNSNDLGHSSTHITEDSLSAASKNGAWKMMIDSAVVDGNGRLVLVCNRYLPGVARAEYTVWSSIVLYR